MKYKEFIEQRIYRRDAAVLGLIGPYARQYKVGMDVDVYDRKGSKVYSRVVKNDGKVLVVEAHTDGDDVKKGQKIEFKISNDKNME